MFIAPLLALCILPQEVDFEDFLSPEAYAVPIRREALDTVAVKVSIEGKDHWLLLDTGALGTYLEKSAWDDLPGAGSDEKSADAKCGQIQARLDVSVLPTPVSKAFEALKIKVDGVLGLDFLKGCGLGLDLANEVVALFPPKLGTDSKFKSWFGSLAYVEEGKPAWMPWASAPVGIAREGARALKVIGTPAGYFSTDLLDLEGRLGAAANVAGVDMDCLLDTGASTSTFLLDPVKSVVQMEKDPTINYTETGPQLVYSGHLATLKLGDYVLTPEKGVLANFTDKPVRPKLALLGIDLLEKNKVLIDFGSSRVGLAHYLAPASTSPATPPAERYYDAEIYESTAKKIWRIHGTFKFPFPPGSVILSGAERLVVDSATDGLCIVKSKK